MDKLSGRKASELVLVKKNVDRLVAYGNADRLSVDDSMGRRWSMRKLVDNLTGSMSRQKLDRWLTTRWVVNIVNG